MYTEFKILKDALCTELRITSLAPMVNSGGLPGISEENDNLYLVNSEQSAKVSDTIPLGRRVDLQKLAT